jgi:hypothetical protein
MCLVCGVVADIVGRSVIWLVIKQVMAGLIWIAYLVMQTLDISTELRFRGLRGGGGCHLRIVENNLHRNLGFSIRSNKNTYLIVEYLPDQLFILALLRPGEQQR